MYNAPSRREKRESKFYIAAERGNMSCDTSLFKTEEKTLKTKHGLDVVRHGDNQKKSIPSTASWEKAFKNGIPLIVIDYCTGTIDTFPKSAIENWAQELYVIAARANFEKEKKAQTNNE